MTAPEPSVGQQLAALITEQQDQLPLPGSGNTLQRWQRLAAVAEQDLALVKLFEGHTDALAILAELSGPEPAPGSSWATWAAEPPTARLRVTGRGVQACLDGRKAWCSGANAVTHAVVTAWDEQDRQCLAAVELDQPGVHITTEGWHAVGMGRAASGDVVFEQVPAVLVGAPGDYTGRPGFWHGGAGIAACWYGGAVPLATALAGRVQGSAEPHAAAHLGAVDLAMRACRAVLHETAEWIDANPTESAQVAAMRARGCAEESAELVLRHAGRALGAGPLCRDASLAQRYADLPVFLRQSHAERDRAELGRLVSGDLSSWTL